MAAANDLEGARTVLDKVLKRSPGSAPARALRAGQYMAAADYDRAIADFDIAIKDHSPTSALYTQRGLAWQRKGDLDRAGADFDAAIKIDASDVAAWHTRAQFHALRNDFDQALADNARALAIRPADPALTAWRAKWERDRLALADASANARAAAAAPPSSAAPASAPKTVVQLPASNAAIPPTVAAAMVQADYAFLKGRFGVMRDITDTALHSNPDSFPLRVRHAHALHLLHDDIRASGELDRVLAERPDFVDALYVRGLVRKDQGQLEAAKSDLTAAATAAPNDFLVQWALMQVALAQHDTPAAMPYLATYLRLNPTWPALTLRLNLLLDANNLSAAEQDIATGDRWGPGQAYAYLTARGRYRLARNELSPAIADLNAALAGIPRFLPALRWRSVAFERVNNYIAAVADVRSMAAAEGNDPIAQWHRNYATTNLPRLEKLVVPQLKFARLKALLDKGDYLEVVAQATKEIDAPEGPGSAYGASFHLLRASALASLGRLELALADYDKTITLDPRADTALSARARLLAIYFRRYDNAQIDVDRALSINPRSVDALIAQAIIFSGRNETIRALTAADSAVGFAPQIPDTFVTRGMVHMALDHDDQALADFATALALQPRFSHALYLRGIMHAKRAHHLQAIADFDAALATSSRKTPAMFMARAKSFEGLGETGKALSDYENALGSSAIGPIEAAMQVEARAKVAGFTKALPAAICGRKSGDQCL